MTLSKINRKVPNKLYHYTDLTSIVGIVTNRELWLSNLYYLNDKQEYKAGLLLFRECLDAKLTEYRKDEKISIFLNSLVSAMDFLETSSVFTLSLSEEPDLLSQWRGYADNCRGVRVELSSLETLKGKGILLLPCIYEKEEHLKYVNYILDSSIILFNTIEEKGLTNKADFLPVERPYSDAIQTAGSNFISAANVACAVIKNKSFKEENEWRLLDFNSRDIFFRTKFHYVVPYIKMKIEKLDYFLTDAMICASPESEIAKKSIRFLFDYNGFKTTQISQSEIPYRI